MKNDNHRDNRKDNKFSDDMLASHVADTTLSAYGIVGMADTEGDLYRNILGKSTDIKGVKISRNKEDDYVIDVYVIVAYGIKIPQLAWELQRKIQWEILMDTGIKIEEINIHIEGVDKGETI